MISTAVRSRGEKIIILIAALCIIGGGALFVSCQWSTGIGREGVLAKLLEGIGVGVLGAGTLVIGIVFARWVIADFASKTPAARRDALGQLGLQFGTVLLNLLVYGCIFLLALGGISALDNASAATIVVVIAVWALCIIGFIAYRRYRKKHRVHYGAIGQIGMTAFMLALGAGLLVAGAVSAGGAARDLQDGPKTDDVFLVDASTDYPSWRYRSLVQKMHVLTFYTPDGERIVVEVPESDIAEAKVINDYGNFVHLTYYPSTQVFCSATPWPDGHQTMGEELLAQLNQEYDFELLGER